VWSKVVMGIHPMFFSKSEQRFAIERVKSVSENKNAQMLSTEGVAATLLRHSGEVKKPQWRKRSRGGDDKQEER
jgi:hypothetical protein